MHVDEFDHELASLLQKRGAWSQVVSIDLETKITRPEDFLSGERILAAGMAFRAGEKVVAKTIVLEEETDEAELRILERFGRELGAARPLVLLGYNVTGYDFPLLLLKIKQYDSWQRSQVPQGQKAHFSRDYWALKDALTRPVVLDAMHLARYRIGRHDNAPPKYLKLSDVIGHELFCHLPLMRCKGLTQADGAESKGDKIYRMWKEKDPDFEKYLKGDVHDTLLIAEHLLLGDRAPKTGEEETA